MISDSKETVLPTNENKQWPQWLSAESACLGFFCVGVAFSWSSPSVAILQSPSSPIPVTNDQASWITSLMQLGAIVGPIIAVALTKTIGPKTCILISAIPFALGCILIILAESPGLLYLSRIFTGIGVGFTFATTPLYIAEISEKHNRGALMFLIPLHLNLGAIFVCAIGPYVTIKTMAGLILAFPILLTTIWFAPESPLFHIRKKEPEKALEALSLLRRQKDVVILQSELDEMKTTTVGHITLKECFKEFISSTNQKAFGIGILTILAQQLCGATIMLLYLESIYRSSKVMIPPDVAVIFSIVLQSVVSLLSIRLPDRWGRKPLLLLSSGGCFISNGMLAVFYTLSEKNSEVSNMSVIAIIAINVCLVASVIGLTPIPSLIASEIFSANVREFGISVLSMIGACLGFGISKLFQVIEDGFGSSTVFFVFMTTTMIFGICLFVFLPETKGKSFGEIQEVLEKSRIHLSFK